MALKAIVETIDSVPEAVRGLYKEAEGKFILDVESVEGYALEDVSGLKSTLGADCLWGGLSSQPLRRWCAPQTRHGTLLNSGSGRTPGSAAVDLMASPQ